jgi:hypothetical protein
VGIALACGLCGALQILHRPARVPSSLKVHRQFGCNLARPPAIGSFLILPNAPMQMNLPRRRETLVHHVVIQRVDEGIAASDRAVWPFIDAD